MQLGHGATEELVVRVDISLVPKLRYAALCPCVVCGKVVAEVWWIGGWDGLVRRNHQETRPGAS